jgi:type II secretory pathway pseudopilin PulG
MTVKHQKAFSLVTSIFVIVLMATVGILVMNMTAKTVKETTTQYRKEQAVLLAKSYTEFAIMAVTADDRTAGCIENINGNNVIANDSNGKGYQVDTRIYYIGKDSTANLTTNCAGTRVLDSTVNTEGSDLQIIVDVYVKYKELDNTGGDWITYHRRTLQKI